MRNLTKKAFTLVELLAVIAIIAALVVGVIVVVPSFVSWARQTSERQTFTVLNDALTRYKTEGGGVNGLDPSTPVSYILARMQQAITFGGSGSGSKGHIVLQKGFTYPAQSLSVKGSGAQFRFTRVNSYISETGGVTAATTPPFVKGDFGGLPDADGGYNCPDGSADDGDLEGFLLALNNPTKYLSLNPSLTQGSLVAMGDFGGGFDNQGGSDAPDGFFTSDDISSFIFFLNDPDGYNSVQP